MMSYSHLKERDKHKEKRKVNLRASATPRAKQKTSINKKDLKKQQTRKTTKYHESNQENETTH